MSSLVSKAHKRTASLLRTSRRRSRSMSPRWLGVRAQQSHLRAQQRMVFLAAAVIRTECEGRCCPQFRWVPLAIGSCCGRVQSGVGQVATISGAAATSVSAESTSVGGKASLACACVWHARFECATPWFGSWKCRVLEVCHDGVARCFFTRPKAVSPAGPAQCRRSCPPARRRARVGRPPAATSARRHRNGGRRFRRVAGTTSRRPRSQG